METNPNKNEKLVALPSGIYLIEENLLESAESFDLTDTQNVSFEVMEAIINFLMLQQNMDMILTLDGGVQYRLELKKIEEG